MSKLSCFLRSNRICTGGAQRWNCDIPCDQTSVIDLSLAAESRVVAHTEGNADMGAPDMLTAFVNFCTENYPADHFALIFRDHGGGPLLGYGDDELFDDDSLLLTEMKSAMAGTAFREGNKLDFVGFDACLMRCLESMSIWSKYADYYVASSETEPGAGWDYSFLTALNDTTDSVGKGAFSFCSNLEEISVAKGNTSYKLTGDALLTKDGKTLVAYPQNAEKKAAVPDGVEVIGTGAFDAFLARTFSVDADNPYYTENEGALMNKAGDQLAAPATDGTGRIFIPDGTVSLSWDVFDLCGSYTPADSDYIVGIDYEAYLPESVTRFESTDKFTYKDVLIFHCAQNSAAWAFAADNDITHDNLTCDSGRNHHS